MTDIAWPTVFSRIGIEPGGNVFGGSLVNAHVRHGGAGGIAWRVDQPVGQVAGAVGQDAADIGAAGKAFERGPNRAAGKAKAGNDMAVAAAVGMNGAFPARCIATDNAVGLGKITLTSLFAGGKGENKA